MKDLKRDLPMLPMHARSVGCASLTHPPNGTAAAKAFFSNESEVVLAYCFLFTASLRQG
jgi:hypothetical protein